MNKTRTTPVTQIGSGNLLNICVWFVFSHIQIEEPQAGSSSKSEKIHIYKNVLLISVSFLALFIGFESMSKLQSSINSVSSDCPPDIWNSQQICEGEQPGDMGEHRRLRQPHPLVLLHAEHPDQEVEGEVDPGGEHPLLLLLHRGPVLPRVLHPHTHRLHPRHGSGSTLVG